MSETDLGGGPSKSSRRLLVIDDEEAIASLIRDVLVSRGYEVVTDSGGDGVIELACQQDFGLILSDYAIPGLNGLEFVRQFTAARPEGRVLIVSAYLERAVAEELSKNRAVIGWLRKPFNVFDLLARVDGHFSGRPVGGERDFRDLDELDGDAFT